jgi:hypothetical protein
MTGTPRALRGPVQHDRDSMNTTHDLAPRALRDAVRAKRTAPTTPPPQPVKPQPGGLSAAEIRRIVLDILG